MRLSLLTLELPLLKTFFPPSGEQDPDVRHIRYDTRAVSEGDVFVALRGSRMDGHLLFGEAEARGAVVVVGEDEAPLREAAARGAVALQVVDTRSALALLACANAHHPARKLCMLGVTGTNGKTTTTYLTEGILRALGKNAGVIGTVEYRLGETRWPAPFTTPEAPALQEILGEMQRQGATHVMMEVSSHGLAQKRVGGIRYQAVAFTNLTQDHLDFHHSMEEYFAAKRLLFTEEYLAEGGAAVINLDDPKGKELIEITKRALSFSIHPGAGADIEPRESPRFSLAGVEARLKTPQGEVFLKSPLVGPHNLSNLLTAFGLCLALGQNAEDIAGALERLPGAPGRLERIPGPGFDAFVDYAHSPDALSRVLAAMRPLSPGRLIAVFGCGGDRDQKKRPKMGLAVAERADLAVVTSDNPRTEDPLSIIEMILPGVREGGMSLEAPERGYWVEPDRKKAIRRAISLAKPGDAVLIFGKGHEDYQILGTKKIHFDDREEARACLQSPDRAG